MYQFINQLEAFEEFGLNLNGAVWILSESTNESVIQSTKFSSGLVLSNKNWMIDLSVYSNQSAGLSILSSSLNVETDPFETGEADAIGLDLLIQRRFGPMQSWVNYSLSRNQYSFPTLTDDSFAAPNDQTHRLNWINRLSVGKFQFSLSYQYKTGLPFTEVSGFETDPITNENEITYDVVNEVRLPDYHRLDLGVTYSLAKSNPRMDLAFSILNLTDRTNQLDRNYFLDENDNGQVDLFTTERRLLGRTPVLMLRFYW